MRNSVKTKTSTKYKLIKTVSKPFIIDYLFKPMSTFEIDFQKELDTYLNFETKICNIDSKNHITHFDVMFDDNVIKKAITFTVESTTVNQI